MEDIDSRLILLLPDDNVLVARKAIAQGSAITIAGQSHVLAASIDMGHKLARCAIATGEPIVKYGATIGTATCAIAPGDHVHLHNVKSNYTATHSLEEARAAYQPLSKVPK